MSIPIVLIYQFWSPKAAMVFCGFVIGYLTTALLQERDHRKKAEEEVLKSHVRLKMMLKKEFESP